MRINEIPIYMVKSLIYTVIVELGISIILGVRDKKDILNIILINIFTNLIVTSIPILFNYLYDYNARNIILYILEILTVIVEGFTYKKVLKYKKINGYVLSLILNVVSYLLGYVVYGGIY